MSKEELLNCPFCGFKPIVNNNGFYYQISCSNLHCLMKPKTNFLLNTAWEAWNRRPQPHNQYKKAMKLHFEANMLDGDDVYDCGKAMISAESVWEYIKVTFINSEIEK